MSNKEKGKDKTTTKGKGGVTASGKGGAATKGKGGTKRGAATPIVNEEQVVRRREVVRLLTGIFFTGLAIFTLVALISYLFTWQADHSLLTGSGAWSEIVDVENSAGKAGFFWANLLLSKLFGLGSLLLPFFFGAIAAYSLRIKRFRLLRTFYITLYGAIIISLLFSYIFSFTPYLDIFGGGTGGSYGYLANRWLIAMIGAPGAGALIILLFIGWLISMNYRVVEWFNSLFVSLFTFKPRKKKTIDPEGVDGTLADSDGALAGVAGADGAGFILEGVDDPFDEPSGIELSLDPQSGVQSGVQSDPQSGAQRDPHGAAQVGDAAALVGAGAVTGDPAALVGADAATGDPTDAIEGVAPVEEVAPKRGLFGRRRARKAAKAAAKAAAAAAAAHGVAGADGTAAAQGVAGADGTATATDNSIDTIDPAWAEATPGAQATGPAVGLAAAQGAAAATPTPGSPETDTPRSSRAGHTVTEVPIGDGMTVVVHRDSDGDDVPFEVEEVEDEAPVGNLKTKFDPRLDLPRYKAPGVDLLDDYADKIYRVSEDELERNKRRIVKTLSDYKISIDRIFAKVGATVTLYEIVPSAGVRISQIKRLEDDIALSLAARGVRIIAPIPGSNTVGIEVANSRPSMVPIKGLLAHPKFLESGHDLPVVIGRTISNEPFIFDLAKMPHLLVAGATGQGKSVGLNAIIASLLYTKHPSEMKLVLIDPKKVELSLYSKIEKHFLAKLPDSDDAIITDTEKVVYTLKSLTIEMDHRYDLLKSAKVRNVKEYNEKFLSRKLNPEKGHHYMHFIVVVIDEFADLLMTAGREIEEPLVRLAQLARAIGIHLVIATQRPTTNIITGLIKANFPARIAYRVISNIDSRTILEVSGANQLVGKGDMLISVGGELTRVQCAYVDTKEVDRIAEFIADQQGYPSAHYLPEYKGDDGEGGVVGEVDLAERDKLFEEAAKLVVHHQQGSTSLIQRRMNLGYNRAGRIMDQLEAAGIVGPLEGSKAREVLVSDFVALDEILRSI